MSLLHKFFIYISIVIKAKNIFWNKISNPNVEQSNQKKKEKIKEFNIKFCLGGVEVVDE